jgi:hypothetical protein
MTSLGRPEALQCRPTESQPADLRGAPLGQRATANGARSVGASSSGRRTLAPYLRSGNVVIVRVNDRQMKVHLSGVRLVD